MSTDLHEKGANKYNVGDNTPKGVITCVMQSRHPMGSLYVIGGKKFYEWQLEGIPRPEPNTRIKNGE